jgi:hypothetical protein
LKKKQIEADYNTLLERSLNTIKDLKSKLKNSENASFHLESVVTKLQKDIEKERKRSKFWYNKYLDLLKFIERAKKVVEKIATEREFYRSKFEELKKDTDITKPAISKSDTPTN